MWKVIIADDEKLICRLIEALVDWEKLNMRIAGKAENGLEALQMVRELRPHLLITDIRMPGCDGLDLIRQARELSPDIEIVIISGCAHFEYAQTAIAYGVGNYILKPVSQAELNKTLQKILLRLEEKSEGGASRGGGQTGPQRLREYLIRDLLDGRREFTEEELAQNYQFHVQGRCVQAFLLKLDLDGGELGGPATPCGSCSASWKPTKACSGRWCSPSAWAGRSAAPGSWANPSPRPGWRRTSG